MYLDNLTLINFSFSTSLTATWPQIEQNGMGLETQVGSFGYPSTLTFHN
jgi:hypothetical protein